MYYRLLANLVVLIHLTFILFAVLGGILVFWRRRWAWVHIPALLWAVLIAFVGWVCPLTPLENWFRDRGGASAYSSGFIDHYIVPILYPTVLTRRLQIVLGLLLLGINLGVYGWVIRHDRQK